MAGRTALGSWFSLFAALVGAGSMWFYAQTILIPSEDNANFRRGIPGAKLADLYPVWTGSRELIRNHQNPYGPEVTKQIQIAYFGRPLDSRPEDQNDPHRLAYRFAYPVYVSFLLLPWLWTSFATARLCMVCVLVGATLASVFLWLRFLQWEAGWMRTAILASLVMSSPPIVQGLRLQQLGILVSVLVAISGMLLLRRQLFLSGVILALSTIKPQITLLLVIWLLFWVTGDWKQRKNLAAGFAATLIFLIAAGEVLAPGWLRQFLQALATYDQYAGPQSLLTVIVGRAPAAILSVLVLLSLSWACFLWRREPAESPRFALALALVLTTTVLILPILAPYNQALLMPAVFLVFQSWPKLWKAGSAARILSVVFACMIFWPWVAALGLDLALIARSAASLSRWASLPSATMLAIPILIPTLLIALRAKTHQPPYNLT